MAVMTMPLRLLGRNVRLVEAIAPAMDAANTLDIAKAPLETVVSAEDEHSAHIIARANSIDELRKLHSLLEDRIGDESRGAEGIAVAGKPSFFLPLESRR